jgi:hypothetical protein
MWQEHLGSSKNDDDLVMKSHHSSHGTFDMPPQCGPGIIQDRFAPLSSWAGALLTPIFFVSLFWDWILMWSLLIAPLAVWSYRLREHERKEAQYE